MNGLRTSRHADPTFHTQADTEFHGMSFPNFAARRRNVQRSAIGMASEFRWRLRWSTLRRFACSWIIVLDPAHYVDRQRAPGPCFWCRSGASAIRSMPKWANLTGLEAWQAAIGGRTLADLLRGSLVHNAKAASERRLRGLQGILETN